MDFSDQYHVAAVWQRHVMDERNQRRLAELVARRQRRPPRRPLSRLVAALFRRPVRARGAQAATTTTTTPARAAGCAA